MTTHAQTYTHIHILYFKILTDVQMIEQVILVLLNNRSVGMTLYKDLQSILLAQFHCSLTDTITSNLLLDVWPSKYRQASFIYSTNGLGTLFVF